jgi:hypothetical protein
MTADTGDLGVTLLDDMYERRLPVISQISSQKIPKVTRPRRAPVSLTTGS